MKVDIYTSKPEDSQSMRIDESWGTQYEDGYIYTSKPEDRQSMRLDKSLRTDKV